MIGSSHGQDQWVLGHLADKGVFVDFGAYRPRHGNNTFKLEAAGWHGLSFERDRKHATRWRTYRRTPCIFGDVTDLPLADLFRWLALPPVIDYLSIDVDADSLRALRAFPWDTHSFKLATIEHNAYLKDDLRAPMREFLLAKGYHLAVPDVPVDDRRGPFEDWWTNPDHIAP